jgi:hypothetical protein
MDIVLIMEVKKLKKEMSEIKFFHIARKNEEKNQFHKNGINAVTTPFH